MDLVNFFSLLNNWRSNHSKSNIKEKKKILTAQPIQSHQHKDHFTHHNKTHDQPIFLTA